MSGQSKKNTRSVFFFCELSSSVARAKRAVACSQCSVLYWVAMPSCARSPKRFSRAYICAYAYARYAREKLFSRKKTVGPVPWALQGCRVATPSCARSEKRFSRAYIRAYAYARYARVHTCVRIRALRARKAFIEKKNSMAGALGSTGLSGCHAELRS